MADLARHSIPRLLAPRMRRALRDTPAVLIHGPRQCGKTTIARMVGDPLGYHYLSFDDDANRTAARNDPIGFVQRLPPRSILDEVQHVPGLFSALKLIIDRKRSPGRFILTGSANVLFVPQLADSLAGRMEILRLHPLSQCEINRTTPRFLDVLFRRQFRTALVESPGDALSECVVTGGFPAALARRSATRRRDWYDSYVETQIQRDVRDLMRIRALDALPRLLSLVAARTAQLVNVADLAAPFELSRQTIHEYVTLLERVFLLDLIPPWHRNRFSRAVKRPKIHIGDTGVACALLGLGARDLESNRSQLGHLLESFVLQELRRQASGSTANYGFFHFRDRDDFEVDIVIEHGTRIAGVDVKASATVDDRDLRGLRKLRETAGASFAGGVVVYDGSATIKFADSLFAVPIRNLWEGL